MDAVRKCFANQGAMIDAHYVADVSTPTIKLSLTSECEDHGGTSGHC